MKKNYIPAGDAKMLEWAKNLNAEAVKGFAKWKIAAPELFIETPLSEFETALEKLADPNHGKIDVSAKNAAKKTLGKACREYVQGFLARNPLVTDLDRERLGITIYDTIPTSIADPTGQADAKITYPGRTQLMLHIQHVDGTFDRKTNYGCRVYFSTYAHGETPPASGKDLRESKFTRQKKMLFTFQPADSGKTAYFVIRYENSKGSTGPWGPMFSAIIP